MHKIGRQRISWGVAMKIPIRRKVGRGVLSRDGIRLLMATSPRCSKKRFSSDSTDHEIKTGSGCSNARDSIILLIPQRYLRELPQKSGRKSL